MNTEWNEYPEGRKPTDTSKWVLWECGVLWRDWGVESTHTCGVNGIPCKWCYVDPAPPQPEMPETVHLTDIRTGESRFQLGEYSTTPDDVYKHPYIRKSKYDELQEKLFEAIRQRDIAVSERDGYAPPQEKTCRVRYVGTVGVITDSV